MDHQRTDRFRPEFRMLSLDLRGRLGVVRPIAAMQLTVESCADQIVELRARIDELRPYGDGIVVPPDRHEIDSMTLERAVPLATGRHLI